jgi:hypothetical protein
MFDMAIVMVSAEMTVRDGDGVQQSLQHASVVEAS